MTREEAIKAAREWGKEVPAESQKKFRDKWGEDAFKQAFLDPTTPTGAANYSPAAAAGVGAAQGASMGLSDELAGAYSGIGAGVGKLKDVITGPSKLSEVLPAAKEAYTGQRDFQREYAKNQAMINPKAYMAGEIGGSVLPSIALGGAGLARAGLTKAAPALAKEVFPRVFPAIQNAGVKIGQSALGNAVQGAAQGLGYSEGKSIPENVRDIVTGGVVGGAVGAAVPAAGAAVKWAGERAKDVGGAVAGRLLGDVPLSAIKKRLEVGGAAIESSPEMSDLAGRLKSATEVEHEYLKKHSGEAQKILKDTGVVIPTNQVTRPLYESLLALEDVPAVTTKYKTGIAKLSNIIADLESAGAKTGGIAADKMHKVNQQIGDLIEWVPKKDGSAVDSQINSAFKKIYGGTKEQLREVGGPVYQQYMDDISQKLTGLAKLRETLGSKRSTIEKAMARSEGKRGTDIREQLEAADKLLIGGDVPYSEQVKRALAKEAFESGAIKTGFTGAIGMGLGGGVAGGIASAAGAPPEASVPIGLLGGGLAGFGRGYFGPKISGSVLDALSASQKNKLAEAVLGKAGQTSRFAGEVLPGVIRTEMLNTDQPNRIPVPMPQNKSDLEKLRQRLRSVK